MVTYDKSLIFTVEDDFQNITVHISTTPEFVGLIEEPQVMAAMFNPYKTEASFFVGDSPPYPESSTYIWDQSFLI